MSVYRRKYWVTRKDGTRVQRTQEWYTIEVRHPVTRELLRARGFKDRKASKKKEQDWITRLERGEAGLLDPYAEHRLTPFQPHIDAFIANLKSDNRDDMYVYTTQKRLERVVIEAGWRTLFEASQKSFEEWKSTTAQKGFRGKKTQPKTLNQYLATLNEFFDWCVDTGRLDKNPLAKVRKAKEIANDNYRRAATKEEMKRFLPALPSDDLRRFYIFLAYTALRRSTLKGLRWDDLHTGGDDPYVVARGENNKPGRKQLFPLRRDVAQMMDAARIQLAVELGESADIGKMHVFPKLPTIDEHKAYLASARIPFDDENGQRRLDIHAFRKTLHTWMEDAGVDVREASKALGHIHLTTTLKSYHEKRSAKREAGVERLPSLLPDKAESADNGNQSGGQDDPQKGEG